MAILTIPKENRTIERAAAIADYLAGIGVDYEIWETAVSVATDAPAEEILAAYSTEIVKLKEGGGYVTADVIDVKQQTQGLDEMLAKLHRERRRRRFSAALFRRFLYSRVGAMTTAQCRER